MGSKKVLWLIWRNRNLGWKNREKLDTELRFPQASGIAGFQLGRSSYYRLESSSEDGESNNQFNVL